MAQDLERLVVSLEANLKKFESEMARASKVTITQLRKIEGDAAKSMGRVEKSFSRAGSALAGFGKGLVIGGIASAVAGLTSMVAASIATADAIGDLSEKLGITSDKLQELQYGAVQAEIGIDELEKGLLKFSKSLGEAQNGSGQLLKILEANGFSQAEIQALSFGDALDIVADLIKNAKNQQDALLVTLAAFGKNGAPYLEFLANGSSGLKGFAKDAHAASAVIDEELIKAGQNLQTVWAQVMASLIKQTSTFVLTTIKEFQGLSGIFDKLQARSSGVMAGRFGMSAEQAAPFLPAPGAPKPLSPKPPGNFGGSGGFLAPTQTIIPDERAEKAALKLSEEAFAESQRAKSDAIKRLIDFSIEQQHRAADIAEEATERQLELDRELYDSKLALAEAAYGAFEAITIGGEKASEVIKDLASSLLKAAVQASLFGSGPFASLFGTGGSGGIFGSLFGKPAGRAGGGHVNAGQPYMVGEKRPELFVPSQSGSIVPKIGGGGTNVQIIDQRSNAPAIQRQQGADGSLRFLIRDAVLETLGSGKANKVMQGQFGANPVKARR